MHCPTADRPVQGCCVGQEKGHTLGMQPRARVECFAEGAGLDSSSPSPPHPPHKPVSAVLCTHYTVQVLALPGGESEHCRFHTG